MGLTEHHGLRYQHQFTTPLNNFSTFLINSEISLGAGFRPVASMWSKLVFSCLRIALQLSCFSLRGCCFTTSESSNYLIVIGTDMGSVWSAPYKLDGLKEVSV